MNEEKHFLEAISIGEPNADLIYADWLEEQGRPETDEIRIPTIISLRDWKLSNIAYPCSCSWSHSGFKSRSRCWAWSTSISRSGCWFRTWNGCQAKSGSASLSCCSSGRKYDSLSCYSSG